MQGCIYTIGRFISLLTFLPIHFILVQAQTWCNVEDIQVFGCIIYTCHQAEKCRREDWEEESDDGGRRTHHRYDLVS